MKKQPVFEKRTVFSTSLQKNIFPCLTILASWFCCLPLTSQAQNCDGTVELTRVGSTTGTWVAPATGGPWEVQITATGAGGGTGQAGRLGGGGATLSGTFVVQNGETVLVISGGPGGAGSGSNEGGGGSGSGAVNCGSIPNCAGGIILIIAAGGNGGEQEGNGLGGSAATGGAGGGGAGGGSDGGGGGGGEGSNGGDGDAGGTIGLGGGQVLTDGIALGGTGSGTANSGGSGMGGGGGGGTDNSNGSGGGAGHTGAAGGNLGNATSFNSGANPTGTNGTTGAGPLAGSVTLNCLGSLPIKLVNFKAVVQDDNTVRLLWSTATEKNNLGFEVERSADSKNWSMLGFVPGNGNSFGQLDYTFADEKPFAGINYYRLKQTDADGTFDYSPMVMADVYASALQFDIYPNPSANGDLNIRTINQIEGGALLEIYDWAGYKVYKQNLQLQKGTMIYPVSLATYPKGTYTARLKMPDGQILFKKIVLH